METFYYDDLVLEISEGVYCPADDSTLLVEFLEKQNIQGKKILEIGTGSGFVSIIAAKHGAIVDACDINPDAIECAKANADGNDVKIDFFVSDLFENVKGKYDIIVFNPPYLPEDEQDKIAGKDRRYSGGVEGKEVIEKFLQEAANHLNSDGCVLLITSSLTGEFKYNAFSREIVGKKKVWMEELLLLKLQIKANK